MTWKNQGSETPAGAKLSAGLFERFTCDLKLREGGRPSLDCCVPPHLSVHHADQMMAEFLHRTLRL